MTLLADSRPTADPIALPAATAPPAAAASEAAAEARRLHRTGWTVHRIAVELRTNDTAVRELLAEAGVNLKQAPRPHTRADSNDALSRRASELYWNGAPVARVAWELGVSRRTVWRLLSAAGTHALPGRPEDLDGPALTPAARAAALYRTGLPAAGVAHMMGITERSARRLLGEAGVTMRAPANVRRRLLVDDELGPQAAELYRSGLAVHAVAVRLRVSDNLARRLLLDNGVTLRAPRGRRRTVADDDIARD